MRAGIGPISLMVLLSGCHSKTKATADLLANLDTELSRTEVEAQKCLRALDERSEALARKLSLLHETHQRAMFRNYANVVPLVRAESNARRSVDAFLDLVEGQRIPGDPGAGAASSADAVGILSAHAAKGLEWDVVCLAGQVR